MKRIAVLGVLLLGVGCTSAPTVFPSFAEPPTDVELLNTLNTRTDLSGFSGVVSMDYSDPEVEGSLEAIVNWRPEHLRVTAYKGVVVTDIDVFDLLVVPAGYALSFRATEDDALLRGSVQEFTRERPKQAGFYWVGEALLLPGRTVSDTRVTRGANTIEVSGLLHSGARAVFRLNPDTGAVRGATVQVPGEARSIELSYSNYTRKGKVFLPRAIELRDPLLNVAVDFVLDEGEPALEFPEYVFDLDDVGSE